MRNPLLQASYCMECINGEEHHPGEERLFYFNVVKQFMPRFGGDGVLEFKCDCLCPVEVESTDASS